MKALYLTLGWLFVIVLFPFMVFGSVVAIGFFSCYIGFDATAKFLLAWKEKM